MKKTRVYLLSAFILLSFSFLIYRLSDIQLFSTEAFGPEKVNLLERSVGQRSSQITLADGRGTFLDRDKKPLNNYLKKDIVIFPFVEKDTLPNSIQDALQEVDSDWDKLLQNTEPVFLSQKVEEEIGQSLYELIQEENIPGIITVERKFSNDKQLASHLIGSVRDNPEEYYSRYADKTHTTNPKPIGISGLEETFDPFLQSENEQKLLYHVDGKGEPLLGVNLKYQGKGDSFYPLQVQTTIDSGLQAMTERVIDQYGLEKGGLVLLDIESRDILAMTSRPAINQDNPYQQDTIKNQMLTVHFPGSIFKTVIAAATIENKKELTQQTYNCDQNLYEDGQANRLLGTLTFTESFAQSCNYTFAELGKELVNTDEQIIESYAHKLGLLGPVGWKGDVFHFQQFSQLQDEETGSVWGNPYDRNVPKAVAQTAIGQKEVKVTPLAVANMMATIADEGNNREVKAVSRLLYNNGTTMTEFTSEQFDNGIEPNTAVALQQLLRKVVTNGTGSRLNELPVAGKSGTAEIGKSDRYHHWFAGFFPYDNPKYAMVVVDLDQTNEKVKTYEVFRDVTSNLLSMEENF